jgi:hypothetical protein
VAVREPQGQGKADHWQLSERAQEWRAAAHLPDISGTPPPGTVPEMSGGDGRAAPSLFRVGDFDPPDEPYRWRQ